MVRRNTRQFYLRYRNRRKAYQNKLYSGYHSAIKSVFDDVLVNLEQGVKKIPSTKDIQSRMRAKTKAGYRQVVQAGFKYGLMDVEEAYGRPLPVLLEKEISDDDLLRLGMVAVVDYIQEQSMAQVVTIAESLHGKLRSIFEQSAEAMEGRPELAARIQAVADPYPKWMANRIAQTETTRAFNNGALEGYEKSTVVSGKEWVTNLMGNPRPEHEAAHGQVVPVDKPFSVGGEDLMFPGDSNGSPKMIINCHCGLMPVITI